MRTEVDKMKMKMKMKSNKKTKIEKREELNKSGWETARNFSRLEKINFRARSKIKKRGKKLEIFWMMMRKRIMTMTRRKILIRIRIIKIKIWEGEETKIKILEVKDFKKSILPTNFHKIKKKNNFKKTSSQI